MIRTVHGTMLLALICTGLSQPPALQEDFRVDGEYTEVDVYADSDPQTLARLSCRSSVFESCFDLTRSAVQRVKHRLFGHQLVNWTYSAMCGCLMPPREKINVIQSLHIPKTGTAINFILHDYFHCPPGGNGSDGCPQWLDTPEKLEKGLCNGRLYSCQGHRTHPNLPNLVLNSRTNLITMMRDPWQRAISDYNYILNRPDTQHLSPEQNISALFPIGVFAYLMAPGISNCATKMLNGYQCGEIVQLQENHLNVAKQVLSKILFVGLTDQFLKSLCLFSWLYGGEVKLEHTRKSRQTKYTTSRNINEVLTIDQILLFRQVYRFDIELYTFAAEMFDSRFQLTGCL